jgi:hypothetical protein
MKVKIFLFSIVLFVFSENNRKFKFVTFLVFNSLIFLLGEEL